MAERFTSGPEMYRSETGLKYALQEMEQVQQEMEAVRAQEEQERAEEAARLAEAEEMRRRMSASAAAAAAATAGGQGQGQQEQKQATQQSQSAGGPGFGASPFPPLPFGLPNPFDILFGSSSSSSSSSPAAAAAFLNPLEGLFGMARRGGAASATATAPSPSASPRTRATSNQSSVGSAADMGIGVGAVGAGAGAGAGASTATATATASSSTVGSGARGPSSFVFPEPELPDFLDVKSLGLAGRWEEVGGNFLLRPPDHATVPPKAVLHFLGGAFVGAAPHLTYRYLLTGLAERGFLVVATPYELSFDYVQVCDRVLERFERVAIPLAKEYGPLPVVGIGHSCGALLHVLITCLFPDTPRAANALISFNNQRAQKAIPGFEELIVPLSVSLMGGDDSGWGASSSSAGAAMGAAAGAAMEGATGVNPLGEGGPLGPGTALRQSLGRLRRNVEEVAEAYSASPLAPSVVRNELLPLFKQTLSIVDQLPPLLQSISDGTREFAPTPDDTREVCRRMYRARRTLLVQFENDSIDESESLLQVLQESRSIMRMKRPLVKMDVRLETITGTHVTPLAQDVFQDPPALLDVLNPLAPPLRRYAQDQFLATVRRVQDALVEWLEEGLAR